MLPRHDKIHDGLRQGRSHVSEQKVPWASLALRYTDLILAISGTMALTSSGQ